ncbi:MAG: hypothetical protein J1E34_03450 [Oscillospiraceae bacterium]|nr:hypothetical protein [Oscillospiraceae bacterium]
MKNYFDLQHFAEGEGAETSGTEASGTQAENTALSSDSSSSAENERTADADEKSAYDTKKTESPSSDGGESEGEEPSSPKNEDRLLQSLETALGEKLKNAEVKRIIDDWEKSGEELKEIYPGFDLKRELKNNGDFRDLLKAGVSVRRAYETANLEKILGSALRYAVVTAGKKTADSVRRQSGRVQENSVLDRASSLSRKDVNSLTKNDILKILDEVSRGAKIKF